MKTQYSISPEAYQEMNTEALRENFLVDSLFNQGKLDLIYWENDRTVIGSVVPQATAISLEAGKELAADFFCQRREVGVLNIGEAGTVTVDGTVYAMDHRDCLYIGRGSKEISFASENPDAAARFYILSYPAHTEYPTALAKQSDASPVELGDEGEPNQRTIYKYIHPEGIQSCQLMMGITQLKDGSVWNTMPAHTHERRTEVYLYFGMKEDSAVFHFMGPGDETRHLLVHNEQATLSPIWSIHSGCGTASYTFAWGMGGENQEFTDMDFIAPKDLK